MSNPTENPRFIYKFRNFEDGGRHLGILEKNQIWFASPAQFNDPFDCRITQRYDLGSSAQVRRAFERAIESENPSMAKGERRRRAKLAQLKGVHRNLESISKSLEGLLDVDLGIFSMSANFRSILNWSHYSSGHEGFCIGFDVGMLRDYCGLLSREGKQPVALWKVAYSAVYPVVDPYGQISIEGFKSTILTKSSDWEYEREFRITFPGAARKLVSIPPAAIRRVILGCRISDANRIRLSKSSRLEKRRLVFLSRKGI